MPISSVPHSGTKSREIVIFGSILLVAGIARFWGCWSDFWLDEIWSLSLAESISSPIQVFTQIHHDNNNHLNTLFLYLAGKQDHWIIYRIPSLLAGIGSVALTWIIGCRRSLTEAVIASSLVATSYLLTHYASEARGYSLAVFFSLLTYELANRSIDAFTWKKAVLFSSTAILGFLSHLTFLYTYLALLVWMTLHWIRVFAGWRPAALRCVQYHTLPLLFFALLYTIDIRHQISGGGAPGSWGDAYLRMLAYTLQGGAEQPWKILIAVLECIFIAAFSFLFLWKKGSDRWLFFGLAILGIPALLQFLVRFETVYERHFLPCSVFVLLAFSYVLAQLFHKGFWGKSFCLLLVTWTLAGNIHSIANLLIQGRGHYLAALRFMVNQTKNATVTIGSDHDFRNKMVLLFYGRHLHDAKPIVYYDQGAWPASGPEWLIFHDRDRNEKPPLSFRDAQGNEYRFTQTFPYSNLSGWDWLIYHNTKNHDDTR